MNIVNQFKYKYYLYFSLLCIVYIISAFIGFFYGREDFHIFETMNLDITIPELQMSNPFDIFISILRNNLTVSLIFFLSGLFSFGILPMILIFYNGFILGNVLGCSTYILCYSDIFSATFPHFLEFVGLNIFGTIGFYLSYESIVGRGMPKYYLSLRYLTIGTLIILVTALLESYISI